MPKSNLMPKEYDPLLKRPYINKVTNEYSYLKYFKVIRYFFKAKYKLNTEDLDMLLFLYSEPYFTMKKFEEYDNIFGWSRVRFRNLMDREFIYVFREQHGRTQELYDLTPRAKNIIKSFYNKLNGEEMPMTTDQNPMMRKNVCFSDKVYRMEIKKMNKEYKRLRLKNEEEARELQRYLDQEE